MSEIISFPKLGFEVAVKQIAFSIAGFEIYWYAIIIAIGVALGLTYALSKVKLYGVNSEKFVDVVIVGLIGSILFARLYYVIFKWEYYKDNINEILSIRDGGIAIYGALIGAVLFGSIAAKLFKVKILPALDIASIGFLIGQAVGRWGNFFNVEAFGSNTSLPWGMHSAKIETYLSANQSYLESIGVAVDPSSPVHPTFLYESFWCILGFVLLHFYSKRRKFDGEVFLLYISWYSLGRTFIEGLRTDSLMFGPFRTSQVLAIFLFVCSIVLWFVFRVRVSKDKNNGYLYCNTQESELVLSGEYYKNIKKSNGNVDEVQFENYITEAANAKFKKKTSSQNKNLIIFKNTEQSENNNESEVPDEDDGLNITVLKDDVNDTIKREDKKRS